MGVPAGAEQVQRELHADKQILAAEDSQNGLIDLMKATRTKAWPEVSEQLHTEELVLAVWDGCCTFLQIALHAAGTALDLANANGTGGTSALPLISAKGSQTGGGNALPWTP